MNEERKSIWEQFADKSDEWVGGTLWERDRDLGVESETEITEIEFDGIFFRIKGKEFTVDCNIQYLGVDGSICGDGWTGFSTMFGNSWRIKKPERKDDGSSN